MIETGIKGGTLHAVNSCLADNKPLACLKHPEKYISHPKAQGNKMLVSEKGAMPITDKNDIVELIEVLLKDHDGIESQKDEKGNHEQLQLFDS